MHPTGNNPPTYAALLLQDALQHQRAGNLAQAEAFYRQVLQHDPTNAEAWINLGQIAAAVKNHAAAVQLFSRALALDPHNITTRLDLAASMKSAGQRAEALALFQGAWTREFGPGFLSVGDFGIRELIRRLCTDPIGPWDNRRRHLRAYAELVEEQGAFRGLEPLLEEARASVVLTDAPPTELQARLFTLLHALGFLTTSDKQWNAKVFHKLALPWMKEILALGHYDLALKLENDGYVIYVKQTETEQHFRYCFSQWVPAMREAGQRAGAGLGPVSWPDRIGAPVVGFFLHQTSLLAHVEVLLNMLEGWTRLDTKPFIPRMYVFGGRNPTMVERFAKLGVPVVLLEQSYPEAGQDWFRRLLCLRERCAEDQVSALVWVSVATMMPFAFALRVAPVQIWWAMKYHSLEFEEIDGYMTIGAFKEFTTYNNRPWRVGHTVYLSPPPPDAEDKARAIRAQYTRFEVILGSLGREEKIDSPDFLEALAQILRANPNACYLWTGRKALPSIQQKLEELGIAGCCFFVGWVDIPVYARVLDVFLDTFPFPCATTGLETMAAGKPLLMCLSPEAMETGVPMMIKPVFDGEAGSTEQQQDVRAIFTAPNGESLFLLAVNAAQYIAYANRLIQDPDFRALAGEAARVFVQRYMQNRQLMAESFSRHLREIIGEKRPH